MKPRFLPGDIVSDREDSIYVIIPVLTTWTYVPETGDTRYTVRTIDSDGRYHCCRMRKDMKTPDRRFMEIKTTNDQIGKFTVYKFWESKLKLLSRASHKL